MQNPETEQRHKFDIESAVLGDIKNNYILLKDEVPAERLEEVQRKFSEVIESFLKDMGLEYSGKLEWKALDHLPDTCSLPDETREKLDKLVDWIKQEFNIELENGSYSN